MKIAILGAGSIGCFVGGAWQVAGESVRYVGRPRITADVTRHGLILTDSEGWDARIASADVDFSTDPATLAAADLVILTVKSGETGEAARLIRKHALPGTTVLSLQNGISNIDTLKTTLGDAHPIVRGSVPYNVAYLGAGHFHKGVAGQLLAEDVPVMRELAESIGTSPAGFTLRNDMLGIAWGKLLINLNNAVNALSGRTLMQELSQRDYRRVVAASMREGLELLTKAGIKPAKVGPVPPALLPAVIGSPDFIFNRLFLKLQKIDARARSSMADDLVQGRKTEVDFLNGEIVALAESHGLDAPVNRRIIELIRDAEAGGRRDWSPAELRKTVLG